MTAPTSPDASAGMDPKTLREWLFIGMAIAGPLLTYAATWGSMDSRVTSLEAQSVKIQTEMVSKREMDLLRAQMGRIEDKLDRLIAGRE